MGGAAVVIGLLTLVALILVVAELIRGDGGNDD